MTNYIEEILTNYNGQELPSWVSYPCFTPHEKSCNFLVGNIRIKLKYVAGYGLLLGETAEPHPYVNSYVDVLLAENFSDVGHLVFEILVELKNEIQARKNKTERAKIQSRAFLKQVNEAKTLIINSWDNENI